MNLTIYEAGMHKLINCIEYMGPYTIASVRSAFLQACMAMTRFPGEQNNLAKSLPNIYLEREGTNLKYRVKTISVCPRYDGLVGSGFELSLWMNQYEGIFLPVIFYPRHIVLDCNQKIYNINKDPALSYLSKYFRNTWGSYESKN